MADPFFIVCPMTKSVISRVGLRLEVKLQSRPLRLACPEEHPLFFRLDYFVFWRRFPVGVDQNKHSSPAETKKKCSPGRNKRKCPSGRNKRKCSEGRNKKKCSPGRNTKKCSPGRNKKKCPSGRNKKKSVPQVETKESVPQVETRKSVLQECLPGSQWTSQPIEDPQIARCG